jgi:mannose-6-phosphate isomerase-like protein (cupin superfamily)
MVDFSSETDKGTVFSAVQDYIQSHELSIDKKDDERPWGGFFVIENTSLKTFIHHFFPEHNLSNNRQQQALSPKILLVQPGKRLSWQYHYRRSEVWKVVNGPVGIILSDDDDQTSVQSFSTGEVITIDQGQRHRLVGLKNWAVIAEIWQHTDPDNPSDEDDIVRLDDDFGR